MNPSDLVLIPPIEISLPYTDPLHEQYIRLEHWIETNGCLLSGGPTYYRQKVYYHYVYFPDAATRTAALLTFPELLHV